jgi:alkyl hydroperoxide reductase subunit AhpF
VLVVEHEHFGGQITITSEVVNYPGVLSASGEQLTVTMRRQAEAFGAEMLLATVESLDVDGDDPAELPFVEVARADGAPTGMRFHGVSGGHEFTSFVLGLYNASGPGQPIANEDRNAIESIARPVRLRVRWGSRAPCASTLWWHASAWRQTTRWSKPTPTTSTASRSCASATT